MTEVVEHSALPAEVQQMTAEVVSWKLEKFDGDPPQPGEHKLPVEIIRGGKDRPTLRIFNPTEEECNGTD